MEQQTNKTHYIKIGSIILLVIIVVSALFIGGFFKKNGGSAGLGANGQKTLSETEIKDIVGQVSDLILIPSIDQEKPLIATVVNSADLKKEQAFYKDAENDDYLIIYPSIAKAIIYRSSIRKIINAGPIVVQGDGKKSPNGTISNTDN